MFDDSMFEKWLDNQTNVIVEKMGSGEKLESEDMMVLVLKAQTNHFHHLDVDMRNDMQQLRTDMNNDMQQLRIDMDKRFEQVDKRFEQVDKRFDAVIARMDRFMIWSLGLIGASTTLIITMLK